MNVNETRKMGQEIRVLTLVLMAVACILCFLLFPAYRKEGISGILIGSLTGIIGFNMITNMVGRIDSDMPDIKARAIRSYVRRYLLYAVIFALSVIAGANILGLLVGMLLHKASILLYSYKHRKEDV